ncbi:hypothetical protein HGM15179_006820 [Zosterops borbonicus]|uniref:Uncharacterized protein n=1 Tax=Zosterops borbonicus TaxID=364589 RepID=A0A8K1GJT5_9PASS|nr:hypothetical protein HGM15179_006820 [Zosterops borbonicus]
MMPSNERKSRAASYSLNRKVIAKTVTSSTHPIPGLAPKGHCVQTDNTKIVMNKDYFTTSCSHFRRELKLQRQDEDHQLRQKTLANPDKNHFLAKARRNSFLTTMPISSTFWCHKRNEINIRQTLGIDIRKEPSRNETTGLDEIREGHRKEIRTIQPTLDT